MHVRKTSPRRPILNVQQLEQRENPAGNLTASVSGGVLTLTGTDQAETFTIVQNLGNTLTITGTGGTTINTGTDPITTAPATAIRMRLLGGDDTVTLDPSAQLDMNGTVTIDGGNGNNTVNWFTTSSLMGMKGFQYIGGEGSDTVTLGQASAATLISGPVSFSVANGGSTISVTNTIIDGEFTSKAGIGVDGLTLADVTAKRSVNINVGIDDSSFTATGTSAISGNFSYQATAGNDVFSIENMTVNGKGGMKLWCGTGFITPTISGLLSLPNGGLTINGQNGETSLVVNAGSINMGGDFLVQNRQLSVITSGLIKANNATFTSTGIVTSGASIGFGPGNLQIQKNLRFNATGSLASINVTLTNATILGDVITTSTGSNVLTVINAQIQGNVNLTSTNNTAQFIHDQAGVFELTKNLAIKSKFGSKVTLRSTASTTINGQVSLISTAGSSDFQQLNGVLTIRGRLSIRASGPTRLFEDAYLLLNSTTALESVVMGDISLTSTTGDSVVDVRGNKVSLGGKMLLNAYNNTRFTIITNSSFNAARDVSLNSKIGRVTLSNQSVGDSVISGKVTLNGATDVQLQITSGGTSAQIDGDVLITSPRGLGRFQTFGTGKTFNGRITINAANATFNQNTTTPTTYAKNITMNGGIGNDRFTFQGQYSVAGLVNLNFGDGNNLIDLSSSVPTVNFANKIVIKTGNGTDVLKLTGIQTSSDIQFTSLAGSDTIEVDGGSVIGGAFLADIGSGDDVVKLGQATGLATAAATFTGKATIKTGVGNDTLFLGLGATGDSNSTPVFSAVGSRIELGANFNVLAPTSLTTSLANLLILGL